MRRKADRLESNDQLALIKCQLVIRDERSDLSVVNFHHRGACLRTTPGDFRLQDPEAHLSFAIGLKNLEEKIHFRLVWETIAENGQFGVEFKSESVFVLSRAQRFLANQINSPVLSAQDPLDPNRILYFKVINASTTGLGLTTSLSNKHLFPGMELRTALMEIPGIGKTEMDLYIENSRLSADETLEIGVSVRGNSYNYNSLMAKYLSNLGQAQNDEDRIEQLSEAGFLQRELREHLTIREVKTAEDYEKVLKLRFLGYSAAGKVADRKTWKDMGQGLETEGLVLAAFLGGQLVASAEVRMSDVHKLLLSEKFVLSQLPGVTTTKVFEVNKLVIHTKAQGSDVVLGMFQKIHAVGMLNGVPDYVCAAEPRLIQLYERIGFHKTELQYPHPVKADVPLTLMVLPHQTYSKASNINPFAWNTIYGTNIRYLEDLGLTDGPEFSVFKKLHAKISKLVHEKRQSSKKKSGGSKKARRKVASSNESTQTRSLTDPKWTTMHLNATVMWPYLLISKTLIGEKETLAILYDFCLDFEYFQSVSNWISIDFFDAFLERFSQHGDPYILNRRAGLLNVSPEILGSNYYLLKHCLTPGLAIKSMESSVQKFNKTRVLKVLESGSDFSRIRISNPDPGLLPKHPSAKENWYAVFEGIVQVVTNRPARIEKIKSAFDGDDHCEFVVHWENPLFSFRKIASLVAGLTLMGLSLSWAFRNFSFTEAWGGIFVLGTALLVTYFWLKAVSESRKYKDVVDSLREYEKHSDERYRELQNSKSILEKSYQEGRILEDIHREIQTSDDLSNLLQTALDSLCAKFAFKRAFTMILDPSSMQLRTSAVTGMPETGPDVWKFTVDVSRVRDNALVLSSVFHSGQSILISDLEEHKFHLNEASRQLVEGLKSHGFAIVPIPSQGRNWGVICADKGTSNEVITRRDLVALQRISQSLGLALDKKAKIESEIRARKIFQKFVPSTVVESTLGETGPTLGGQTKDVICLFLDIRDFTALSNQLPSEILVDLLNQIFEIVHKNVALAGGIIDKFIGDGVLVHWGAVPGSEPEPQQALQSARQILIDLAALNLKLHARGMRPVEVGIGIHRGKVTVGNIGSQERMEFTIVGSEVNFASRLEGLNKVYKSNIIVSENLIAFTHLGKEWIIHSDVQIRGVTQLVRIAAYTQLIHQPFNEKGVA